MVSVILAKLMNGIIFGDAVNKEYLYLPAGECGAQDPLLIYEHEGLKEDILFSTAQDIITKRSLKPVVHPMLGNNSF